MRLPSIFVASVACLLSSVQAAPDQSPQFHNAAIHPGADPHVIYNDADGLYYAYSTEGADKGYHFAIYSSPDLSTWHRHPGGVLKACQDDQGNPVEGGQACWARDWFWAPETYHNEKTGWYFFFFAGRLQENLAKDYFRYSLFEEPSKIGVVVSRSPTGPWREIKSEPIGYYPFDPEYHDVNLLMDEKQMLPPQSLAEGQTAPKGTYIPTIDVNIFFDEDERVYMYLSRNAYRNWNWDQKLGKYIEESNIIVVEMDRTWWDDPDASTMPEIAAEQIDINAKDAPELPSNITSYNGVGELGTVPRKDGFKTVISYGADPEEWENYHVDDYTAFNGSKKDRRWSEGSTLIKRPGKDGKQVYMILYSANNFEASNYGVGFATSESPMGPFVKSASNPVLSQIADGEFPIYSTGHGSVVASPPDNGESVGAQDVTLRTPHGAELFYVHHGRNATTQGRTLYTTRMTLGSDNSISMHLTGDDQPLPNNTYPIRVSARYGKDGEAGKEIVVRVSSRQRSPFDLREASNRVVSLPGDQVASSIADGGKYGTFVLGFEESVSEIAYQRKGASGVWSTVATSKINCK